MVSRSIPPNPLLSQLTINPGKPPDHDRPIHNIRQLLSGEGEAPCRSDSGTFPQPNARPRHTFVVPLPESLQCFCRSWRKPPRTGSVREQPLLLLELVLVDLTLGEAFFEDFQGTLPVSHERKRTDGTALEPSDYRCRHDDQDNQPDDHNDWAEDHSVPGHHSPRMHGVSSKSRCSIQAVADCSTGRPAALHSGYPSSSLKALKPRLRSSATTS